MSNIFQNIPQELKNELFEEIISNQNIKIERIVSDGHTSPEIGWYDSSQNEWVIILQGDAIISFENNKDVQLHEGDYLNIPSHTKHKVSYTSKIKKSIWLAVYY